jgi:glycine/D-amino acid oxidase-like deaminating enzyme
VASAANAHSDVIVVGAGLAGLACSADLLNAGLSVRLLEASDAVGGRMRTDTVAGFRLDRGFQVFNTSYPQVKRRLDLRALRLRPFTAGLLLAHGDRRVKLGDPTRGGAPLAELVPGRFASARDLAALGALAGRDLLAPAALLRRGPETTTRAALARAGVSDALVEALFRPFLAGVFLDDSLETSGRFFHLVLRSMLRGTLCLPASGVRAVPDQLAAALPQGTLRLGSPVLRLEGSGVCLADGTEMTADAVVVATGAGAATVLLPDLDTVPGRTVTTYYHAAARSPLPEPTLVVDGSRAVLHTCVLTEVAPTYSADGRALVSTSVLGGDEAGQEARVRGRLGELYRTDTGRWEHIATRTIPDALPAMPAPHPLIRSSRLGQRRYLCGDHRATGSLQGALASGSRAARDILADRQPAA